MHTQLQQRKGDGSTSNYRPVLHAYSWGCSPHPSTHLLVNIVKKQLPCNTLCAMTSPDCCTLQCVPLCNASSAAFTSCRQACPLCCDCDCDCDCIQCSSPINQHCQAFLEWHGQQFVGRIVSSIQVHVCMYINVQQ